MNYPEYKSDLQRIHESEVYGVAVFESAARLTRNAERKAKWLTLKALEEQTLARYLHYMESTEQPIREPRFWQQKGRVEGAALALMPWRMAMKLLADGTLAFQERFLRLKSHADGEHKTFFNYVYAHEKAIEAFALQELQGEEQSLKAAKSLLSQ